MKFKRTFMPLLIAICLFQIILASAAKSENPQNPQNPQNPLKGFDYLEDMTLHVRSVLDTLKPDVKGKIFVRLDKSGQLLKSHMLIESMGEDDRDDLKHLLDACKPFKAPPKAYQSTCCFKITIVSTKHSQSSFVEYLGKTPVILK